MEEEKVEYYEGIKKNSNTQNNSNIKEYINKTFSSKNQEVNSLKLLIKENKELSVNKINSIKAKINDLKNALSLIKIPNYLNTKKMLEQNLIKQKLISNTISVYKEEFDSIKENINLLEEDHNYCLIQLYNLISIKDNYEEIIKENSKYIFKNLMISYDQSTGQSVSDNVIEESSQYFFFNSKNSIKIEFYDVNNIQNLPKFSNYIYKILSSHITSLITENNIKALIFSSIEEIYYKFIKKQLNGEEFIKKISYNIAISDDKIHNFIIIPRLELLLKYVLKIFSLEKIINDYMKFLNNDYLYNKNIFQKKFNEIKINIQKYTKEKLEYKNNYIIQEKEYNQQLECIKKIEKIKSKIYENEQKIKIEHNKYTKLENNNRNIYSSEYDVQKTIKHVQENINNLLDKIKNGKISEENKTLIPPDIVNIEGIDKEKIINRNNKNDYKTEIKCDCYILICNLSKNSIFDPLNDYDIRPESKGYNKSLISLENKIINIKLNHLKEEVNLKIDLNSIINITILENMKKIIYYRNNFKIGKNNVTQLLLNKEKEEKIINLEEIIKCFYNKYFCLSIVLSNGKIINFIFLTYNSFKIWLKLFDDFCQKNKQNK